MLLCFCISFITIYLKYGSGMIKAKSECCSKSLLEAVNDEEITVTFRPLGQCCLLRNCLSLRLCCQAIMKTLIVMKFSCRLIKTHFVFLRKATCLMVGHLPAFHIDTTCQILCC
uniref:Secreted protein n=1 Tax=Mesocestoides corti TaxID=53468 RepID=A0A5K3G2T5_MESCO